MNGNLLFHQELEALERLAEIVNEKDLGEASIRVGDKELTVKGKKCPPPMPAPMAAATVCAPQIESAPSAAAAPIASGNVVKAPIVGTFYAAPSPDDKPYAEVGKRVKKGETIFIIESMKVMSEVQSDFDGVVKEILVSNGDPLDFDQPVMIIE